MAVSPSDQAKPARPARPLKLPNPRNSREARIRSRLERDSTNPVWLPEQHFSPELDQLKETQRKHIGQVATAIDEHRALTQKFAAEDEKYARFLEGVFAEDEDAREFKRTPKERRDAALNEIEDRVWAPAALLADTCDEIVQVFQKQEEPLILPALNRERNSAMEAYHELQAQAEKERAKVWRLQRLGRWVQQTSDDHAFKRSRFSEEPIPTGTFTEDPGAFTRHWADKGRQNNASERPSLTGRPRLQVNPNSDQTGVVMPLDQ